MRSHAKAATAGSTKRLGKKSRPALLACVLAASVAALALVVGSASGATTRFLVETFGSSAQPTFPADRGMAFDQGASQLYVIDSTNDTISRFDADGSPANFSALGSNVIDGEGTGDETPLGHLAFESNRQREQVALDESGEATDGNVYVTQSAKDVVDIFNSEGEYLGALSESTESGAFGEPCGVTVDDEGTVYVGDRGDDRIHVFDPAGAVPVNADSAATSFATLVDPCTLAAGMAATDGFLFVARSTAATLSKLDAATGELKYEIATGASTVSVDPATGHVFVARNTGSSSSVDEYDASGASEATLVSSFKPGSTVEGIALNSASEQVYVARASTENVEVFGPAAVIPDVVTSPPSSNTGTRATLAGTVNPDGVELDECFFEWGPGSGSTPYTETTPCAQSPATIGSGTTPVAVGADISGLKPQGTSYHYRLVAKNPGNPAVNGSNQDFTTPNTVVTEAASSITPTEATLNGTVSPDTAAISECVFEWGAQKGPLDSSQAYPNAAPCVPGPGGIVGTSPVPVSADLSGLHPGSTYVYRLKATYPSGAITAPQQTLQTAGPVIESTWARDVVYTEATLKAQINPSGSATTYRFEYGETEAYGSETAELSVGSDSSLHELGRFLDDLEPGTTYHYRVVATNGVAVNEGPDQALTTYERSAPNTDCPNLRFRSGPSATLPDCRAYEMVSPFDKGGADIRTRNGTISSWAAEVNQASAVGDGYTFSAEKAFAGAESGPWSVQYLASRGADGWTTKGISPPYAVSEYKVDTFTLDQSFRAFTEDLSGAWLQDRSRIPYDPAGVDVLRAGNAYRLDTASGKATALSLAANASGTLANLRPEFSGADAAGKRSVITSNVPLTTSAAGHSERQLYEFADGELHLVSILPNGEVNPAEVQAGGGKGDVPGATNGEAAHGHYRLDRAVSDDGSRIFWTTTNNFGKNAGIYVRIDGETTRPVLEGPGDFWTASSDGSAVVYGTPQTTGNNDQDLNEFDVDAETHTPIAGQVRGVVGASEDLSYLYFISREALVPGSVSGERNLYLRHDGTTALVATLDAADNADTGTQADSTAPQVAGYRPLTIASRVSPDGRSLIFMSTRSLTGFDNTDAIGADASSLNGDANFEVFRYDADTDELNCVSCNPSGSRPVGRAMPVPHHYIRSTDFAQGKTFWAAAFLPTWETSFHGARSLSADGRRVFFNAFDALVPGDTNGQQDVYQWEAPGKGGCVVEGADYSELNGGCVSLISTGQSGEFSEFLDAGVDGDNVFFKTQSSIDPRDPSGLDIYDARVGGGYPPPPLPPPACIGDACQPIIAPPSDQTPASASFRGRGNSGAVRGCRSTAVRAVRLSRTAKRFRLIAKRATPPKRKRALMHRSTRAAKRAKRLSRSAKRCRRANRRAKR